MKEAKKEANRIARAKCRRNRHWIEEINKLNGKKRFTPESIRWCVEQVTLAKKLNKRDIQWEEGVQLSRPGTVKFYGNSPKPMERAVIVRPRDSYDKRSAIEASRIQYKHPQQKSL